MIKVDRLAFRTLCIEKIHKHTALSTIQSKEIIDQFFDAEFSGKKTHGLVRLPWFVKSGVKIHNGIKRLKSKSNIDYFSGKNCIGYLGVCEIVEHLKSSLDTHPIKIAVVSNLFPIGVLGYHAQKFNYDDIVIIFGTTPNLVGFDNNSENTFGTNPICISFSYSENGNKKRFLIDMATSQSTFGDILLGLGDNDLFKKDLYLNSKGNFPKTAIDLFENNRFTGKILQKITSRSDIRQYCLMLIVSILTNLFTQEIKNNNNTNNYVFMRIKKSFFCSRAEFSNAIIALKLKDVNTPGYKSSKLNKENSKMKFIHVNESIYNNIINL